jgi:hypothetical protein
MNVLAPGRRSAIWLFHSQPAPRPYDCALEALHSRHHSRPTEVAHLHWIYRFLAFQGGIHRNQS